jgi:hypothetical protein
MGLGNHGGIGNLINRDPSTHTLIVPTAQHWMLGDAFYLRAKVSGHRTTVPPNPTMHRITR